MAYIDKFIDLHLHLDGAITPDIAKKVAKAQNMELPVKTDEELKKLLTVDKDCNDLNEFLKRFDIPGELLLTKEGISEAVFELCENLLSEGFIYAEIRFAPQRFTWKGLSQEEAVIATLDGLKRSKMKANLIMCFMRGDDNKEENLETLELAKKYLVKDGGIVALDIAGAEGLFKTSDYEDLFKMAKEAGIPYTIHAGEADGPESVKSAIAFGTKRIGHGVRAFEDEELLKQIKDEEITLEMCPTSNYQTHAFEDMDKYPFMDFLHRGIKVTLNTDDPGIEGTSLKEEYEYMERKFGLSYEDEKILLLNAIDAAFTTEEVKADLRARILPIK